MRLVLVKMEKMDSRRLPEAVLNQSRRRAVKLRLAAVLIREAASQYDLSTNTVMRSHRAYEEGGWAVVKVNRGHRPKGSRRLISPQQEQEVRWPIRDRTSVLPIGAGHVSGASIEGPITATSTTAPAIGSACGESPCNGKTYCGWPDLFNSSVCRQPAACEGYSSEAIRWTVDACVDVKIVVMSDIVLTITAARSPVIKRASIRSSLHISTRSSNAVSKYELDADLAASSPLVAKVVEQAITLEAVEAVFRAGVVGSNDLSLIGMVIEGALTWGQTPDYINSSGKALQDLAIAALPPSKAIELGSTEQLDLLDRGPGDATRPLALTI